MTFVLAICAFLAGIGYQALFERAELTMVFGALFLLLVSWSILIGKNNIAIAILPISVVLGSIGNIGIMGRTPDIYWLDMVVPLTIYCLAIKSFIRKDVRNVSFFKDNKLLLFYILSILLGWLIHPPIDKFMSLAMFYHLISSFITLSLPLYLIEEKKQIDIVFNIFPYLGMFLLGSVVYAFYANPGLAGKLGSYEFHSAFAVKGHARSNYLASLLVLLSILNISTVMLSSDLKIKIVAVATVIGAILFLFWINSIGAIMSFALGLVFLVLLTRNFKLRIIISLLVVSVFLFNSVSIYFIERLTSEIERYRFGSTPLRIRLWKDSLNMFLSHPISGVGYSNKGFHTASNLGFFFETSHNFILQSLAETGLIGSIFIFSFYAKSLYVTLRKSLFEQYRKSRTLYLSACACLIVALSHSMSEPMLESYGYRSLLWFMLGLLPVYEKFMWTDPLS